jgi:hypothetical protein
MNFKKIFAKFPIIDTQFNRVSVDVLMFKDDEGTSLYSPILTYAIIDKQAKIAEAGFMLQTGVVCASYLEVAKFVHDMASSGFFLVDLGANGAVYNEEMGLVEIIDWNVYAEHIAADLETQQPNPTLH